MKKLFAIILVALTVVGLVSCTAATTQSDTAEVSVATKETKETVKKTDKSTTEETADTTEAESVKEDSTEKAEKKTLVVYFSVTGNTKKVAEKIAEITGAQIYEIKPAQPYTDADINYGDSSSRTSKEQNDPSARPEILGDTVPLDDGDTVYLGYPIWWGEEPRIMDTFVESCNFTNATVIPFCTSGSSGIGNSAKNLEQNAKSGNWLEGNRFDTNVSESEIADWIGSLR